MSLAQLAWEDLARALSTEPELGALLGLSGGADSVYLLELLAASPRGPRPLVAVHLHHGLRGAQADLDEQFCRELCQRRGIELVVERASLEARPGGLEARARAWRRECWARLARERGLTRVLLAHQRDDADETALLRLIRGSEWNALAGLRARRIWRTRHGERLELLRPLLSVSRAAVREELARRGLAWREDASNLDQRLARNRVRLSLLPLLGPEFTRALDRLRLATEALDQRLAELLPPLERLPPEGGLARHPESFALELRALHGLPAALAEQALSASLTEALRWTPRRACLRALLASLERAAPAGRPARAAAQAPRLFALGRRWRASLGGTRLECLAPPNPEAPRAWPLETELVLADGRRLYSSWREAGAEEAFPRTPACVELHCPRPPAELRLGWARAGLRFHPLGSQGSRRLVRFLQGCGIPAAARAEVPLVFLGEELIWVAGLRIAHARRLSSAAGGRLRLSILPPANGDLRPGAG
jgi:tRNA(Ile)-lysidine synthase